MFPRLSLWALLAALPSLAVAATPASVDPAHELVLVASEPTLRTPTAVQVDAKGRIWVLENNTHFQPKNYSGPKTDRILILDDFDAAGKAQRVTVYHEGTHDGMGLLLLPDGDVVLSNRDGTIRFHDKDGDGKADEQKQLLTLVTEDKYPHNALSSLVLGPDGLIYLGLGENHGVPWTLTGADGKVLKGSDESGVFRFTPEGKNLEHYAWGFWNPFGLAFDEQGRLFVVDNDPSGGSLCRLLHVVPHGDHGYRYRYGRTIDHPFVSWYGKNFGALPPLCLVGEAPTALLEYRGAVLGGAYTGQLLAATWSDHGIQRFVLEPKGASFATKPEWLVRGGYDFRPSGLTQAPDGSLIIADWVDGSYEVHGKGRIWRLRPKAGATVSPTAGTKLPALSAAEKHLSEMLAGKTSVEDAVKQLNSKDAYLIHGAIEVLEKQPLPELAKLAASQDAAVRLGVLLALRRSGQPEAHAHLEKFLQDGEGSVRRAALQWIGEKRLAEYKDKAELALQGAASSQTFQAYLGALQLIASGKPDAKITAAEAAKVAQDPRRPEELRALALRLLPADFTGITTDALVALASGKENSVRLEAVRLLGTRAEKSAQARLQEIAADEKMDDDTRAEAIAALAGNATIPEVHAAIRAALGSSSFQVRREAIRALRTAFDEADATAMNGWLATLNAEGLQNQELLRQLAKLAPGAAQNVATVATAKLGSLPMLPPPATEPWPAVLNEPGDAFAGRRIFYHPNGPRCYTCHAVENRGGVVGPDLTKLGHMETPQVLEAIREPSKEIAPAFAQWMLTMPGGKVGMGVDLFEDNKSQTILIDATGTKTRYKNAEVITREPLPISIMPPGLENQMTEQEMRDMLAFLRANRE